MKFYNLIIAFAAFTVVSCGNEAKESIEDAPKITLQEKEEAIKLLEKNCYSCHAPDNSGPRLAPPMLMVKNHYLDAKTTEKEFVENVVAYALNPSEDKSRMPGALNKFGLMPKTKFDEQEVRKIAKYLFYGELLHPADVPIPVDASDTTNFLSVGKKVAMDTKAALGKQLFAAVEREGAAGAVEFCSLRAISITDSMAQVLNTGVKRVSDQPRNKGNQANEMELTIITEMKAMLAKGEEVKPVLNKEGGKAVGYYPIVTNNFCLQCHGKKDGDIESVTLATLGKLYPEDKAIGYSENQLRGLFVVEMDAK
jgi:mono/diheme cytochrome c family protein